ncbi:MAG: hypothetical protein O2894_08270, partial [Planctomycetota bacterium]|nr:hypothetical protein [Planctomycetota bacterium]
MTLRPWALVAVSLLFVALPGVVRAEEPVGAGFDVRLADGTVLTAEHARVLERTVEMTVLRAEGRARLVFRIEQFEPAEVLALHDRTHEAGNPEHLFAGADLALRLGEVDEATVRYVRAGALDSKQRARRDEGLARIHAGIAREALSDLEHRVRVGSDPRGAAGLAAALLDGPHAEGLDEP